VSPTVGDPAAGLADLVVRSGVDATGLGGVPATSAEYLVQVEGTVRSFAAMLGRLHATPLSDVERSLVRRAPDLARAASSILSDGERANVVRSQAYRHVSDDRLVEVLIAGAPGCDDRADAPVLTHGAPTLARLRCDQGSAVGLIGWSGAAVADRYRDLAVAARSVSTVLTPHLLPVFFEHYGEITPDPIRLDWYALLDELATLADDPDELDAAP
jgi:aminoglycoside phosphotransferase